MMATKPMNYVWGFYARPCASKMKMNSKAQKIDSLIIGYLHQIQIDPQFHFLTIIPLDIQILISDFYVNANDRYPGIIRYTSTVSDQCRYTINNDYT